VIAELLEQVTELQEENSSLRKGKQSGFTLSNGANMPYIGLGTWQAKKGEVGAAVAAALDAGYRHIDCAACYGNEKEIGVVFNDYFSSGKLNREDVFITSKLWNSEHAPEDVKPALKQTLADLQLGYLDLYLIHWPQNFEKVYASCCCVRIHCV
jgi:alcohol dehydrogenase (NADP+)